MEVLNQLVERRAARWWGISGGALALALAGSTVVWVGWADAAAAAGAAVAASGGLSAAAWRRRLDRLPLELAPVAARRDEGLGAVTVVRAWLGRGRRCDTVDIAIEVEDAEGWRPIDAWFAPGPCVGPFQAACAGAPAGATLRVRVEVVDAAGAHHRATREYAPQAVREGRFAPAVTRRAGERLAWDPARWGVVEG